MKAKIKIKLSPFLFILILILFLLEFGQKLVKKDVITATFGFCQVLMSFSDMVLKQEIHKSKM